MTLNFILVSLNTFRSEYLKWSHLGLNQGLPDYESGALTD